MSDHKRQMHLGVFVLGTGNHSAGWRQDGAFTSGCSFPVMKAIASTAERGKFDLFFISDALMMDPGDHPSFANRFEPLTLLSALSAVTTHVGLGATVSTSFGEPYNLARAFASLDHLSNGRAGWNVVTSGMDEEALNFGKDGNIEHAIRYDRAAEFLDTAKALWDSWEDDAVLIDKASGFFADPARVHRIEHAGKHFKVRGPLNIPRPIQGHPVIVQAGSSEDGKNLAAAHADLHFARVRTIEDGQHYRQDFDARLQRMGREPADLKILPGILPIVAGSRAEAEERRDFL